MNDGKITEYLKTSGMEYDKNSSSWYGTVSDLSMKLVHSNDGKNYELVVPVTNGSLPDKKCMVEIASHISSILKVSVEQYNISFMIKRPFTERGFLDNLSNAISVLPAVLRNAGWNNCCEASGRTDNLVFCILGGELLLLSDEEYGKREIAIKERSYNKSEKEENVVTGIVGAFLGSIIGLILIVFIGQLGRIAILSGLVMGVCTIKGYAILSGKMSKKGVFLSIIIMILMTYMAFILDSCVYVLRQNPEDIAYIDEMVGFFSESIFTESNYCFEFLKMLGFTLLGAVPAVLGIFRDEKMSVIAYKLKEVNKNNGYDF